ncbi:MAG: hypothetical protein ACRDV3_02440 [Acidothermaceae bacterium]
MYPYTARDLFLGATGIVLDYQGALGLPLDPSAAEGWLREFRRSSYANAPEYRQAQRRSSGLWRS